MLAKKYHTLADYQTLLHASTEASVRRSHFWEERFFESPTGDHETSRHHSQVLDELLGFEIERIEQELFKTAQQINPNGNLQTWGQTLHQGNQTWVGLWHQTLQTPYSELNDICHLLSPEDDSLVVDLGAGYGRLGIVMNVLYPRVRFLGFEYVSERVDEGQRMLESLGCDNAELRQGDLVAKDFELPEADYYFIYDYGTVSHIRRTIRQLSVMAETRSFKVIARGKGVRAVINSEHPWLASVFPAHHEENFSIYSMSGTSSPAGPEETA